MINRFLHALTNRKVIFPDDLYAGDPNFQPAKLSPGDVALRKALYLDYLDSDYYLKNYVAIMAASPDVDDQTLDPVRSYDIKDFRPQGVQLVGAALVSNQVSGFFTDLRPVSLPVGLAYEITYAGVASCRIRQVETGIVVAANCILTADNQQSLLRIDWPAGLPFAGPLRLLQPWDADCMISIRTEPSRFPYFALMEQLKSQPQFTTVMNNSGLMIALQNAFTPQDKLALALLAIARSNPAVYAQ